MSHTRIKTTALILAGVVAVGSSNLTVSASTGLSSLLPAAGMALTMEEGSQAAKDTGSKDQASVKASVASTETSKPVSTQYEETLSVASQSESNTIPDQEVKPAEPKSHDISASSSLMDAIKNNTERPEQGPDPVEEPKPQPEPVLEESEQDTQKDAISEEERYFSNLVIAKVTNYVNIRSIPSEEGEILGKLYDKSVGEFIEEENGWYKIKSGSVTGYVKGEYCVTGNDAISLAKEVGTRVAVVNTTTLKVRNEASTESAVLGLVPIEEELTVVEELEGWVKVDIEEGYGYVSNEFVNLRSDFVKAESIAEERARLEKEEKAKREAEAATKRAQQKASEKSTKDSSSSKSSQGTETKSYAPATSAAGATMGQKVVNFAMQFVGNPYVYGGTSLTNGADCSGFVMSVYKNFGVSLPHSSSADRSQGYDVGGLANALPGDLVCYSGHVGIYAGNGKIVHASTAKTGITVSNANYRQVLAVRRIFQ